MVMKIDGAALPPNLQNAVREFNSKVAMGDIPMDIEALIQSVLRESYMEMNEDLAFYAAKVKFHNAVKKEIRAEMDKTRDWLRPLAGGEDGDTYASMGKQPEDGLSTQFTPTEAIAEWVGDTAGGVTDSSVTTQPGEPFGSKKAGEDYLAHLEEKLSSVGDDAQLANVDLQSALQKQQQTLQLMSNVAKMMHDTAMAIIRKIGG